MGLQLGRNMISHTHPIVLASFICIVSSLASLLSAQTQDSSVRVSVSGCHVTTGTPIEAVESIMMPPGNGAMMIAHRVSLIGFFHRNLGSFVLWNGKIARGVTISGLPHAEMAPSGIPMKELGDGRLGVRYVFQISDPGIYLVYAEWSMIARNMVGKKPNVLKGNPVLLFVAPADGYTMQDSNQEGAFRGSGLQSHFESQYDSDPMATGFLLPKFSGNGLAKSRGNTRKSMP